MKKKLHFRMWTVLLAGAFLTASCGDKNDDFVDVGPSVTLSTEEGIFEVKIGRNLLIAPVVEDAVQPIYVWKMNDRIVGTGETFDFMSKTRGQFFITFRVDALNGVVEKEMRVDVLELTPPKIILPLEDGYIRAVTGRELEIVPEVTHSEGAAYRWLIDREEVSTASVLVFNRSELGNYNLTLIVTNEDGEARADAVVRVGEVPTIAIYFENQNYNVPLGRTLYLAPYVSYGTDETVYRWEVDGVEQFGVTGSVFAFAPASEGEYTVIVSGENEEGSDSQTVTVTCVAEEGRYFRPVTEASTATGVKVFEFLPAPGQFVNDGFAATSMDAAVQYAQGRIDAGAYVSLGGFGGYIVVGFDHSVRNTPSNGGYDFGVRGNAFKGSLEPGIVWVMQNENGNGLPDDTWYELKGSEYGAAETVQQYAVTYYKPTGSRQNVRWTDNRGNSGTVDVNAYHGQDSYYPAWVDAPSYTLRGTCLGLRNVLEGGLWYNQEYDWGYVDNYGEDYIGAYTYLDIDNAVNADGTSAQLQYIDFVKVHTAVNGKSGALGEISTEVLGYIDLNF